MEKEPGFGGKQRPTGEEREVILCMGWGTAVLAGEMGSLCLGPPVHSEVRGSFGGKPWPHHSVLISSFISTS